MDNSYRALFGVPSLGRLMVGMQIARIGQAMVSIALVLFALDAYHSARLAGIASFCGIFPGLLISPVAGALLDRHGRIRLVTLDYLVALASLTLIGGLALAGALPASRLMLIAAIASLTQPLSGTGLRSLFPLMVPKILWERLNGMDSAGYVIATVIGPPLAAGIVALWGGAVALIVIGITFGLAALVIGPVPEPPVQMASTGPLLAESWRGLVYTWNNPTLRGLGFSISVLNFMNGTLTIVVPLIVLQRLHFSETVVGLVFAVQGVVGIVSAIIFGGVDSRDRERMMLAVSMAASGVAVALLLGKINILMLVVVMGITGFLNGPMDVAMFTVRQRRTDPAWTGRAFAVSMSFNYSGLPVGSAIAGIIAARSIEAAIVFGVVACLVSGVFATLMIPASTPATRT